MSRMINGVFPGILQPNHIVGGCIAIYENAWPNPLDTIKKIEDDCADPNTSSSWLSAETIGEGTQQNARTNLNIGVTHHAQNQKNVTMQNIHNQYYMLLLAATQSYVNQFNIHEALYHEGYNILKYSDGQQYSAHYDGGTDTSRAISALIYLNDDFEGGETEFINFDLKIKPQKGMLILFPSNFAYSHVAHPVTSGTKYALVTWILDR